MQEASIISSSEAALWGRLFDPTSGELSTDVARYILTLSFPLPDLDRMTDLAKKASAGTLTLEEHIELDNYERVGHMLSLMKSKARKALKKVRGAKSASR
jgi:phosphate uptake regulator